MKQISFFLCRKPIVAAFILVLGGAVLSGCGGKQNVATHGSHIPSSPPTENHMIARNQLPVHDAITIGEKSIPVRNGVITLDRDQLIELSRHENVFYKRRSSRAIDAQTVEAIYRSIGFDAGTPTHENNADILNGTRIFWVEKGDLESNIVRLANQAGWEIAELHLPFSYFVPEAFWMIGETYNEILSDLVAKYPVVTIVKE